MGYIKTKASNIQLFEDVIVYIKPRIIPFYKNRQEMTYSDSMFNVLHKLWVIVSLSNNLKLIDLLPIFYQYLSKDVNLTMLPYANLL